MLVPRPFRSYDFEPALRQLASHPRRYAHALGFLLTPVAVAGYVLAFWRLGADLNLTGEFFISQGLLSRWQVWLALAIAIQLAGRELNKMGRPDDTLAS